MFLTLKWERCDDSIFGEMHNGGGVKNALGKVLPRAPNQRLALSPAPNPISQRHGDIFFHPLAVFPENGEGDSRHHLRVKLEQTVRDPRHHYAKTAQCILSDAIPETVKKSP